MISGLLVGLYILSLFPLLTLMALRVQYSTRCVVCVCLCLVSISLMFLMSAQQGFYLIFIHFLYHPTAQPDSCKPEKTNILKTCRNITVTVVRIMSFIQFYIFYCNNFGENSAIAITELKIKN